MKWEQVDLDFGLLFGECDVIKALREYAEFVSEPKLLLRSDKYRSQCALSARLNW
ncbi:MAG: hypothetical protein JWP41_1390 [Ramlibacter sp.]|nr:hypothetical protein [Ramlibacter sp.]